MKKTNKKPPKASHKKAIKNLDVKADRSSTVRGGPRPPPTSKGWIDI